jgi:Tfp pilus assembly protein PilO
VGTKKRRRNKLVRTKKINFKTSNFYNLVTLNIIKGRNKNMRIVVLIAFGITVIGYFIYILNQQKQQQTTCKST